MNISGIYIIESRIKPQRAYIGSAIKITRRWKRHISMLRNGNHHSKKLQRHFIKYGEHDLQFSVLFECEKDLLIANEQRFIDNYQPYFNTCKIAGSQLGNKHSRKSRINISNGHKGQIAWNKGKRGCYSEETNKRISETLTGKKQSTETVNKRIEKTKKTWELKRLNGTHHPKNEVWNKGKKGIYSEDTLQKIRDARKKQIFTQESQNKKRESMKKCLALKKLSLLNLN